MANKVTFAHKNVQVHEDQGGEPDGGVSVLEAEAEDNTTSCVMCVSCQQAASGAPKCAICDQVCHAIIPWTTATDDENMLEHMTLASTARDHVERSQRTAGWLFFLKVPYYTHLWVFIFLSRDQ